MVKRRDRRDRLWYTHEMARGTPAAQVGSYQGELGRTRTQHVHYSCPQAGIVALEVQAAINVTTDPELAARLHVSDHSALGSVTCPGCGQLHRVELAVLYHDPSNALLVLVVPPSQRHRELHERAALAAALAADTTVAVPSYARDFAVVFGAAGLQALLELEAERTLASQREAENAVVLQRQRASLVRREDTLRAEAAALDARRGELEERTVELERRYHDLEELRRSLDDRDAAMDRRLVELERRAVRLAHEQTRMRDAALAASHPSRGAEDGEPPTRPIRAAASEEDATGRVELAELEPGSEGAPAAVSAQRVEQAAAGSVGPSGHDADGGLGVTGEQRGDEGWDEIEPEGIAAGQETGSEELLTSVASDGPGAAGQHPEGAPESGAEPEATDTVPAIEPIAPIARDDSAAVRTGSPEPPQPAEETSREPDGRARGVAPAALPEDTVTAAMPGFATAPSAELAAAPQKYDAAAGAEPAGDIGTGRIWTERTWIDENGRARLALSLAPAALRDLGEEPELRVLLHELPTAPLVVLALLGRTAVDGVQEPSAVLLDVAVASERAVLERLAAGEPLALELYDEQHTLVRATSLATNELAENVAAVLAAAAAHDGQLAAAERSMAAASAAFAEPSFDRFGWRHPELRELREDKLYALESAQNVRWALHIVRRFSKPERQRFLVLVRSFPLPRWRAQRRAVMERAVALGLWLGDELGALAVAEGLAGDRAALVERLQEQFAALTERGEHDLDEDAVLDNWAALAAEAERQQVSVRPEARRAARARRGGAISSDSEPTVTGMIGGNRVQVPLEVGQAATAALVEMLSDGSRRLPAALELARRGTAEAVAPVFAAIRKMPRAEAGAALCAAVGFGDAASAPLIAGLASHKAYLRHGCALALGTLGAEQGLAAVAALLLTEPTEIWREVARALGAAGAAAVAPLAARLEAADADGRDRAGWALAYAAARGGSHQVQELAATDDAAAAGVARLALERAAAARADDLEVRAAAAPIEQTVNRAFSRRFFEALESSDVTVSSAPPGLHSADLSAPAILLDDADLLEAAELDEEIEPLDESDLLPS